MINGISKDHLKLNHCCVAIRNLSGQSICARHNEVKYRSGADYFEISFYGRMFSLMGRFVTKPGGFNLLIQSQKIDTINFKFKHRVVK